MTGYITIQYDALKTWSQCTYYLTPNYQESGYVYKMRLRICEKVLKIKEEVSIAPILRG